MPQRKSTPAGKAPAGKPASNRPAGSAGTGKRAGAANAPGRNTGTKAGTRTAAAKTATRPGGGGTARPPARKPGKSIVNQKQRPWGLIAATVAVVLFAVAIVVVVVATRKDDTAAASSTHGGQTVAANDPYRQAALPAAMAISGVTYRVQGQHNHVNGVIKYDTSPPTGGNHSQLWANCNGVVYDHQLANENAVHMLEHGAIWITYNPKTLPASQLATLKKYVQGVDRMALTPYAGLQTPISLQAWGYQLFVKSASDPRIAQFIKTLKYNKKTTPEYGASCSDQYFKADQSRPGHPQDNA